MHKYIIGRKIKKLVTVLLIAAFISGLVPGSIFNQAPTASAAVPSVQAKAYVVMDANSGGVIYKKSMNKRIYPASTVKLMTAIVALENADLDKKITFTKKLRKMIPSDASKLGLKAGTTYSVRQYLNMMLIASDADSATALASGTAGTYENFITLMNDTAKRYGMDRTSFDNPSGLDTGNGFKKTYTTAYDFAILARHAMSYETIRNIVSKNTYNVPARKGKPSFKIKNTNGFYSTYKLKGKKYSIIGSKTGTTRAAGRVLIATARDESGRPHHGFIAQDFEELLKDTGIKDHAAFIKSPKVKEFETEKEVEKEVTKEDGTKKVIKETIKEVHQEEIPGEYTRGLRYEEFIPDMARFEQILYYMSQGYQKRIESLEEQLKEALNRIEILEGTRN